MKEVVFVTGNPDKAQKFSELMGLNIDHAPADLDEIQTTDHRALVEYKAREAYRQIGKPVLVEDVAFSFHAWGDLPGTFVKFFVDDSVGVDKMCRMLDGFDDRRATGSCIFGYFDGVECTFFEGTVGGVVANSPRGSAGYGFDRIFEADGFDSRTAAELNPEEYNEYYMTIKPFAAVREFLVSKR